MSRSGDCWPRRRCYTGRHQGLVGLHQWEEGEDREGHHRRSEALNASQSLQSQREPFWKVIKRWEGVGIGGEFIEVCGNGG